MAIQTQVLDQESTNTWKKIYETTIGQCNILTNGNFEVWSGGNDVAPDGWTLTGSGTVARESSTIKIDTYSAKLNGNDENSVNLYQDIHAAKGINYWKGKSVTFGCWVNDGGSVCGQIRIDDGIGVTLEHSTSSGWNFLTITRTIASNATQVRLSVRAYEPNYINVYFDGAIVIEGESVNPTTSIDYSGTTSLTISSLDGNTDEEYRLRVRYVNSAIAGVTTLGCFPNNDSGSNYGFQRLWGNNTDISAGRAVGHSLGLGYLGQADQNEVAMGELILYAKSGYVRTGIVNTQHQIATTTVTTIWLWGTVWNNTADNINSLVIRGTGSETNALGVGTVIELYKKI
jgi:hypothetical protein